MCVEAYSIQTHVDRELIIKNGVIIAYIEERAYDPPEFTLVCDGLPVKVTVDSLADANSLLQEILNVDIKPIAPGKAYEKFLTTRQNGHENSTFSHE